MTIKVKMIPSLKRSDPNSGIGQVIKHYYNLLPNYGINLVADDATNYDLLVGHAGECGKKTDVSMLHGIYWTADYKASGGEIKTNARVIDSVRYATTITVPSPWVAETIQRDMRINPHVIPHGINVDEWNNQGNGQYILWNKNRHGEDVCDATALAKLAEVFTNAKFVTTFWPDGYKLTDKIKVTGKLPHAQMKGLIEQCGVYTSLVKETFCIGVLEAMASGKPILGWAYGGNLDLVEHGINGYLAKPNDYDDLHKGLEFCMKNWKVLDANSREMARQWTWESSVEKLAGVFQVALDKKNEKPSVSVVIPVYNYGHMLRRAVMSALDQSFKADEIIIVNDGSIDNTDEIGKQLAKEFKRVKYIKKENGGVATARNRGILETSSKYVMCLDADDRIEPKYLEACVVELEKDTSLGMAYTGLLMVFPDDTKKISQWPGEFNVQAHLKYANQVPTCAVFRRDAWARLGGYKQRFAPDGAGSEDADFWTRMMAIGYNAKRVADTPLFQYSYGAGLVSGAKDYHEVNWLHDKPWANDGNHPLASIAPPTNKISHLVRQYDEPMVSVIIPVGPGHEGYLRRALDSLETQTYHKWEVIVVFDTGKTEADYSSLLKAYPYAKILFTPNKGKGAGYARNLGCSIARSPFLNFLDADDWLYPHALEKMLLAWNKTRAIIYSDYVFKAFIDDTEAAKLRKKKLLLDYKGAEKEAVITHKWIEYDCEEFKSNMSFGRLYHWCLVNILLPKAWHDAIGGFDESLESWEDVDYHWRLAWAGYCFSRLPEPLVVYRFDTGTRRQSAAAATDDGRQMGAELIKYIISKLKRTEAMACSKCPGKTVIRNVVPQSNQASVPTTMQGNDLRRVEYVKDMKQRKNRASHQVTGIALFENKIPGLKMVRRSKNWAIDYGRRKCGAVFHIHKEDLKAMPNRFTEIDELPSDASSAPQVEVEELKAPVMLVEPVVTEVVERGETGLAEIPEQTIVPITLQDAASAPDVDNVEVESEIATTQEKPNPAKRFNLELVPGVTPGILQQFQQHGISTPEQIITLGKDGLMVYNGIGAVRAETILEHVTMYNSGIKTSD